MATPCLALGVLRGFGGAAGRPLLAALGGETGQEFPSPEPSERLGGVEHLLDIKLWPLQTLPCPGCYREEPLPLAPRAPQVLGWGGTVQTLPPAPPLGLSGGASQEPRAGLGGYSSPVAPEPFGSLPGHRHTMGATAGPPPPHLRGLRGCRSTGNRRLFRALCGRAAW